MAADVAEPLQFVLKATARCNLDCTYCYVFNKADQSWRTRSKVMSDVVFEAAIARIARHCERSDQRVVRLMFHGGEPMLAGRRRFAAWLAHARAVLEPDVVVIAAIQTNATLIDDAWAALFREHDVEVGVSIDGPPEVNDRARVDRAGRGSYTRIVAGIDALRRAGVRFSVLSVIDLGGDGRSVYRHFATLRPHTINFLFPDHTHDDFAAVVDAHGPHPVADFLLPVLDDWFAGGALWADVPLLRNICRIVLGGTSRSDMFGNLPLGFVFIEVDGEIEGLDVLRVDAQGLTSTGLNVLHDDFAQLSAASPFHGRAVLHGLPLPAPCRGCEEETTCAGGYLPHRYSRDGGFDHRSVWCRDILLLFRRMRELVQVSCDETVLRRTVLDEMAAGR